MTLTTSANPFQPSIDRFNALDAKNRCDLMPGIIRVMRYMQGKTLSSNEIMEEVKSAFPDIDPKFALDLVALAIKGHDFSRF